MLATSRWLLPDRKGAVEQLENAREYSFEARVHAGGPLVGKSIAEVGLRNLKSAYVLEIIRQERLVTAVGPDEILQANDRLTLVGVVDAVKDLRRIPGLSIAEEQTFRMNLANAQRQLVELVLSANSPLIGKSVRDTAFRSTYQAAIISISRDGSRLPGKLGDIEFRPGDTLLVEAGPGFVQKYRYSREFLLVSLLQDSQPADFKRAPLAVAIVIGMMVAAGFEWVPLFEASFIAAGLMVLTRCITMQIATRSVDYAMIAGIAASFALGSALTASGAAKLLGDHLIDIAVGNPMLALALVYGITVVVTEIITNNAAGVLMFPIAIAVAEFAQVNYLPFVIAVMVAASAGFITPIGYQTNLMVYGPGGYHFRDFVRLGVPLSLITGAISLWLIPQIWPF
jgi:di/tricarboxylate transporter